MNKPFKSPISWREKLEKEQEPRVVRVPPKMQKAWGTGTMLIATPLLVDAEIRKVKKGKLVTTTQIMAKLAKDFHADATCPMTTGIFIRIAAEEDRANGKKRITPHWRVLKSDGSLNAKYPGGIKAQATHLRTEGHTITPTKTKRPPKVRDFERHLANL